MLNKSHSMYSKSQPWNATRGFKSRSKILISGDFISIKDHQIPNLFETGFQWAINLLVVLMPFSVYWPLMEPNVPGVFKMYVTPGIYLTDFAVMGVIILGSVNIIIQRKRNRIEFATSRSYSLTIPLLLIGLLGIISSPFALSRNLAIYTSFRWLLTIFLYLVLTHNKILFGQTIKFFLFGLCAHTLIGVGQFIQRGPLGLPGELALEVNQAGAARIVTEGVNWLRAYGLTFHPNVLGGFLVVGLLLGLPLLGRLYIQPVWCLLGLGLILSFSRSAWLAAGITIPFVIIWFYIRQPNLRRPLGYILGSTLFISILALGIFWNSFISRLNPLSSMVEFTSITGRGELLRIAFQTIAEQPLFGVGPGNFPIAVINSQAPANPHYVHNVALLLAAEIGVVALILWYWLWLYPLKSIEYIWRGNNRWTIVIVAAWFGLGVISLWDFYPWSLESGRLLTIFLLALCQQSLFNTMDSDGKH